MSNFKTDLKAIITPTREGYNWVVRGSGITHVSSDVGVEETEAVAKSKAGRRLAFHRAAFGRMERGSEVIYG